MTKRPHYPWNNNVGPSTTTPLPGNSQEQGKETIALVREMNRLMARNLIKMGWMYNKREILAVSMLIFLKIIYIFFVMLVYPPDDARFFMLVACVFLGVGTLYTSLLAGTSAFTISGNLASDQAFFYLAPRNWEKLGQKNLRAAFLGLLLTILLTSFLVLFLGTLLELDAGELQLLVITTSSAGFLLFTIHHLEAVMKKMKNLGTNEWIIFKTSFLVILASFFLFPVGLLLVLEVPAILALLLLLDLATLVIWRKSILPSISTGWSSGPGRGPDAERTNAHEKELEQSMDRWYHIWILDPGYRSLGKEGEGWEAVKEVFDLVTWRRTRNIQWLYPPFLLISIFYNTLAGMDSLGAALIYLCILFGIFYLLELFLELPGLPLGAVSTFYLLPLPGKVFVRPYFRLATVLGMVVFLIVFGLFSLQGTGILIFLGALAIGIWSSGIMFSQSYAYFSRDMSDRLPGEGLSGNGHPPILDPRTVLLLICSCLLLPVLLLPLYLSPPLLAIIGEILVLLATLYILLVIYKKTIKAYDSLSIHP